MSHSSKPALTSSQIIWLEERVRDLEFALAEQKERNRIMKSNMEMVEVELREEIEALKLPVVGKVFCWAEPVGFVQGQEGVRWGALTCKVPKGTKLYIEAKQ